MRLRSYPVGIKINLFIIKFMTVSECCILVHMHAQALTDTGMHVHTDTHAPNSSTCFTDSCSNEQQLSDAQEEMPDDKEKQLT